jgi:hypothetical protein
VSLNVIVKEFAELNFQVLQGCARYASVTVLCNSCHHELRTDSVHADALRAVSSESYNATSFFSESIDELGIPKWVVS